MGRPLIAAFLISLVLSSIGGVLTSPSGSSGSSSHPKPKNGAVATESVVCSGVGGDILKQGGTAADAMIASVLCVGVIDGHHSGIGSYASRFDALRYTFRGTNTPHVSN